MNKLLSELITVPVGCVCVVSSQDFSKGYIIENICEVCTALNEKQTHRQKIINELNLLDLKAIRPLLDNETERIAEIQTAKQLLRAELASL